MPEKAEELLMKLGRTPQTAKESLSRMLHDKEARLDQLPEGQPVTIGEPLFPRFRELPASIQALFKEAEPAKPTPKAPKKKKKKSVAPPAEIEFADFAKLQLKVGVIQHATQHPDADRLLVLTVDIGEAQPRTIVAGIKSAFAPEALHGRTVVVVSNLKPATLRGVESQGMVLAAGGSEVIDLLSVDAPVGEIVR
jgi:methionyl-tRNA synthetase